METWAILGAVLVLLGAGLLPDVFCLSSRAGLGRPGSETVCVPGVEGATCPVPGTEAPG